MRRREWLAGTALTAAGLALPRRLLAGLGPRGSIEPDYLGIARECGRWVAAAAREADGGLAWPADPARPDTVALDFYNGSPGAVLFMAELAHATSEPTWRRLALEGAGALAVEMERTDPDRLGAGLYTGLAGLATVFFRVGDRTADDGPRRAAGRALDLLQKRARAVGRGVTWNESNDIISGNAGTGLLLLEAHRRTGARTWLDLAAKAGRRLIAEGQPAGGGLLWLPGRGTTRNYPNFSHGTAGVAYYLATLHQRTGDAGFLDAALAGTRYLDSVAVHRDGGTVIHHHDGGGEDLFYLSWCHGPPGTARLFLRLHDITSDRRWADWVERLTRGTLASGIPERRTAGFWNNISQCCGNVGVGEYFLGLSRTRLGVRSDMIRRIVDDTLARATRDADGARWIQAENRVQPENLVAQTGHMQGASGVGTFFLRLDAHRRGVAGPGALPDSPFPA